jgi:hypothetical protein
MLSICFQLAHLESKWMWPGKDKVNFGQINKEVGIVEQQLKPLVQNLYKLNKDDKKTFWSTKFVCTLFISLCLPSCALSIVARKHRSTQLRLINNVLETSVKVLELQARSKLVVDVQMILTKIRPKRDVRSRFHLLCETDLNSITSLGLEPKSDSN